MLQGDVALLSGQFSSGTYLNLNLILILSSNFLKFN
jgi:hypothetical protein